MKNIFKYFVLLSFAMIAASCDDWLNETPKHNLTEDNVVTDYATAQNIVNGIYVVYAQKPYAGGTIYGCLGSQAGMFNNYTQHYEMSYTQTDCSNASSIWSALYSCLNAANAAVSGVDALDVNEFPSASAKTELLGEARCMRGFFNLNLLWLFGHWFDSADSPYGLLYRDQLANLSNIMTERISVGESYEKVLEDLEYAEQYAPDYTSAKYASKQFAQALHAKLLLNRGWSGDYVAALQIVNNLMQTAPSSWKMEPNISQLYEDAWDSKEVLFARYLGKDDVTKTLATYETCYSYQLYQGSTYSKIADILKSDARYEYTFGTAYGPASWQSSISKKDVCVKLYHNGQTLGAYDKYCCYVFRKAELYLMKAELLARTNPSDIQGALAPLNEMRAQYTTPVLEPITASTQDELMDAIFKEYVVTLYLENETPWFITTRFNHDGRTWLQYLKEDVDVSTDKYCWPIPDAEMEPRTNTVLQNPGMEG